MQAEVEMTLTAYLASFDGADAQPHEVSQAQVLAWRSDESSAQCAANALRYLQGRTLKWQVEQIPHGGRKDWKAAAGAVLGLGVRSLELLIQVAGELDELLSNERSRNALRKELLNRPWREVLAAVQSALAGDTLAEESDSVEPSVSLPWATRRWEVWSGQLEKMSDNVWDDPGAAAKLRQRLLNQAEALEERMAVLNSEDVADEPTIDPEARPGREVEAPRVSASGSAVDRAEGRRRGPGGPRGSPG